MQQAVWRGIGILVILWIVAGITIFALRAARPTPEKLVEYLDRHSIASASPAGRAEILVSVANQLNALTFEQRQVLRESGAVRNFFEELDIEERSEFLDRTLPEGFRQLMLALNKMDPARRKKIVERAIDDLRSNSPELAARLADADAQKIISEGLNSFYEEADANVKLDFAPVIEQLQQATQNLR